MASIGLLRLFIFGLLLCSSLVRADIISSRSWIHAQKVKRSEEIVELSYSIVDRPGKTLFANPKGFRRENLNIQGGITLSGPASRVQNLHQQISQWKIVGCTSSRRPQVVLAYCMGSKPETDCGGIFVGGAKHTVVQLPDGCGASPFARVARFRPSRRSLPKSETKELGNKTVSVFELSFDYDFKAIKHTEDDTPVQLHMEFSNIAGYTENSEFGKQRSYEQWFNELNTTTPAQDNTTDSQSHQLISEQNQNTIPINHDFSVTLASMSQQCSDFDMTLSVLADGNLNGSLSFGYYITGSLVPPNITDHYAYLRGNSNSEVNLTLDGLAQYSFTGFSVPVVPPIYLPGLEYVGLLSLGPYFQINSALTGDIALDGTMTANTGFVLPAVDISIGNNTEPQTSSQATHFGDVTFSKNLQVSAGLTIALVPQVGIQINVLSGLVDADVNLQPSAGITAGGDVNYNPSNGKIQDPCVELDGEITLSWGIGGSVGPWGAATTGRIWGIQKKLWQQCFATNATLADLEWKRMNHTMNNTKAKSLIHANAFDVMSCPSVNPFGNSNSNSTNSP